MCVVVYQGFKLLGILDVQNTPCARDAILHGAGGSLAAGLLHFLATSKSYENLKCLFVCQNGMVAFYIIGSKISFV